MLNFNSNFSLAFVTVGVITICDQLYEPTHNLAFHGVLRILSKRPWSVRDPILSHFLPLKPVLVLLTHCIKEFQNVESAR